MRTKSELIRERKKEKMISYERTMDERRRYTKEVQSSDQLMHEHRNPLNHFHSSAGDVLVHTVHMFLCVQVFNFCFYLKKKNKKNI